MSQDDDEREDVQEPEEIDFHEYDLHGNYLGSMLALVPYWETDDMAKHRDSLAFGVTQNPPE